MSNTEQAEEKAEQGADSALKGAESAEAGVSAAEADEHASFGAVDADIKAYIDASMSYVNAQKQTPLDEATLQSKKAEKKAALDALRAATEAYVKGLDLNG